MSVQCLVLNKVVTPHFRYPIVFYLVSSTHCESWLVGVNASLRGSFSLWAKAVITVECSLGHGLQMGR